MKFEVEFVCVISCFTVVFFEDFGDDLGVEDIDDDCGGEDLGTTAEEAEMGVLFGENEKVLVLCVVTLFASVVGFFVGDWNMFNDSETTTAWLLASEAEPVRFLFLLLKLDNDAIQAPLSFARVIR